uniref:Immunoglobulin domain-containing protein n=1 Tax=Poecilia mexicana TaxID=48701 RepID=A0A3B3WM59_9TELE
MSDAWTRIFTFLCLCCAAETKEVIWRESGQSVTIRCRINTDQDSLVLKMGHNEETEVAVINRASRKRYFHKRIAGRVQTNGTFPSVDIVIENLNVSDSGPYWCVYSKLDDSYRQLVTKGYGSVLLMVTGDKKTKTKQTNKQTKKTNNEQKNGETGNGAKWKSDIETKLNSKV